MGDYYDSAYGYVQENPATIGMGAIIALIVVCLICCCCCSSSAAGGYWWWTKEEFEGFEGIGGSCSPKLTQRKDNHYY